MRGGDREMKLLLLSGGSGKRLWPLSNNVRSKQFLKILRDPDGELESMVQRIWRQLSYVGLTKHTFVVTCAEQVDILKSQLGEDVSLIVEPMRRDTFPAIALAASYLHSVEKVNPDEVVCVLPVDSYVDDSFFKNLFEELQEILLASQANLALLGVAPTYPSQKYGYIVPVDGASNANLSYQRASHFIEKPEEKLAKQLIDKNALWNCGVFAFKISFMLDRLAQKKLPVAYEELYKIYHELLPISFDYEIVEKTSSIVVKKYMKNWKDLGTWSTLTEEMGTSQIGKGMISADSSNTHVINELQMPLIIQGLSDVIVAASPDGILVSHKFSSDKIKTLISEIQNRPMFEECRWGTYRVLDYDAGKQNSLTKQLVVHAGKNTSYETHKQRSEAWIVTSGVGLVAFEDRIFQVIAGSVLLIPTGSKHAIKAISELQIIEVQIGTILLEEDTESMTSYWEDIEKRCKVGD